MRKKFTLVASAVIAAFLLGTRAAQTASPSRDVEQAMRLIEQWVGGHYSTKAQYEKDQASAKPESERHRLMYQLFLKVDVPNLEGLVFFEQGSMEGTSDADQIWRAGFLQFIPDVKLGVVRQRELKPRDEGAFRNAHLEPSKFATITPDLLEWDPNCDFLLKLSSDGTQISGPIPPEACKVTNPGTGKVMYAEDRVVIKPGEFWFLGRYRDEEGRIVWGNESGELNKLIRFTDLP